MDVSKLVLVEPNHDFEGASKEIMRESPSNVTLPFLLRNIDNETDPLEAVKCDPAVLEAQITFGGETVSEPDQHAQLDTIYQDHFEAIKCDPAVLEAQITLGGETVPEPDQHAQLDSTYPEEEVEVPTIAQPSFEELICVIQAALESLTPEQFFILMKYVEFLRMKRYRVQYRECAFCKNNGELRSWYSSHALKDWGGRVLCPVLRRFRCPRCGATGDRAHTIKYCPENYDADLWRF